MTKNDQFRRYLGLCGLTQSEAAFLLEVSPQTVTNWLKGRRTPPEGVIRELNFLFMRIYALANRLIKEDFSTDALILSPENEATASKNDQFADWFTQKIYIQAVLIATILTKNDLTPL